MTVETKEAAPIKETAVRKIAKQAQTRAKLHGWKAGRKRDEAAHFEYWAGAYHALFAVGHEEANHVGTVVQMILTVRGLSELDRLAGDKE